MSRNEILPAGEPGAKASPSPEASGPAGRSLHHAELSAALEQLRWALPGDTTGKALAAFARLDKAVKAFVGTGDDTELSELEMAGAGGIK